MGKKLIVNADDFGICPETNKAVAELYAAGRITSTSLLVSSEASGEAIDIIKQTNIPFGVHLTLNSDFKDYLWGALYKQNSSLADEGGNLFYDTSVIAKKAKGKDVTKECEAQIAVCREAGITPDHLDNHSGTMYGINMRLFFINAFRLSKKYALPFRFPKRPTFLDGCFKGNTPAVIKALHKGIVICSKIMGATLIDDMISNPYPIKDIPSYKALEAYYLNAITSIKDGVTELFLHPSYDSPKYAATTPEWKKRQYELEFLFSPAFENRIRDEGIELISYKDIKSH